MMENYRGFEISKAYCGYNWCDPNASVPICNDCDTLADAKMEIDYNIDMGEDSPYTTELD